LLTFHEIPPSTRSGAPPRQPSLILFSLGENALDMEDMRQAVAKRSPILFCFAIVTPVILMLVAVRISAQFGEPPGVGYTVVSIILCFALSAVILTCGLSI